ncbi:hypothetical protein HY502_01110, partial [Candidatus Woesebacteria bacterium]|nr:hypothetical protein [Candidatus Woesebacteria bacterium]
MLQTLKFGSPKNKKFRPRPHFVKAKAGTTLEGIRHDVFLDRYSLKDVEGKAMEAYPEQMWRRVAWGIAQVEKGTKARKLWEDKFYEAMTGFKFVPAGRILSGAGTGYETTFYNCYVIPSPKDSRQGIMDNISLTVEIQARGGGVGLNLSSLRPRGARVKKVNGTSSGPVNWASLYSTANHDVIQQGGSRRGALMLMLNDWHPDVEEFITVKQDLTKIPGANLSVCISEAFMKAVKADRDWELIYPDLDHPRYDALWDGDMEAWKKKGGTVKLYRKVKARHLWDLIAEAAWRSAEPGAVFIDRYNEMSNVSYCEKIIATNPSLRRGTRVLTKKGIFPIEELEGKKFLVKNLDGKWSLANCFLSGKKKNLFKITLNNGREIYATAEHKWPVLSVGGGFGKVSTDKLKKGNILPFPKAENIDFDTSNSFSRDQGFMIGWLYGDGWISDRGTKTGYQEDPPSLSNTGFQRVRNYSLQQTSDHRVFDSRFLPHANYKKTMKTGRVFGFIFSEEEKELSRIPLREVNRLKKKKSNLTKARDNTYLIQTTSKVFAEKLSSVFKVDKKERGLPTSIWTSGGDFIKGVIDGLLSSDGFVSKNSRRIVYTTKHHKLASDISDLLSFYGIKSTIRKSESQLVSFPNKKNYFFRTFERHDVYIDGYNAVNFAKIFRLSHKRKQKNLSALARYSTSRKLPDFELMRIASVEKTDLKEDVWDIRVNDDTHCFYINHCVTGNCGEQGLGAWGVCNLGHINLSPFVKEGKMDYKDLEDHVRVGTRFLDNVIDANFYFAKENEKAQKYGIRRTGLGTLGLADALIKMGIRYGSKDSLEVIEKIYKLIRDTAYDTSSDLAKEKGAFPKFIKEKYLQGKFIQTLPGELRKKISKQGIRNGILLTQAPTGTISLLSGVSSGIEPVYEFTYKRTDRTGVHVVNHPLYQDWLDENPDKEIPDYFVSASGLTPEEHIRVQAAVQKYVDASISKTVNAPNAHTVADVKKLYNLAYELGCKGVTYFRDGSREGVLSKAEEAPKPEEKKVEGPPVKQRPVKAMGATYRLITPVGIAFCTINQDEEGNPLEIFINVGKAGSDVAAMAEALGRTISTALRFRGDLTPKERTKEIAHQLSGIGGRRSVGFGANKILSLPDAVSYALSLHYGFRVNGNGNGHATNGELKVVTGATSDVA